MDPQFTFLPELAKEVEIPSNGILSRTLYNDDALKVVVFRLRCRS